MRASKSRASVRKCADSPEPSLLNKAIDTKISCTGFIVVLSDCVRSREMSYKNTNVCKNHFFENVLLRVRKGSLKTCILNYPVKPEAYILA